MESKTQIVATIGPASNTREVLDQLIGHHLNIARFNFSWSSHEDYENVTSMIREIAKEKNVEVPIIQDLSGPRVQEGRDHRFGGDEDIITPKDILDLEFGIKQNFDYVAMSYVGNANDILRLRNLIKERGGNQKIIAKIERREAVENIVSIIEVSDGIMVARGDLGNEFPIEEIPFIQHDIIKKSIEGGKFVIVATQMLETMTENPVPTRAEVSDVAYAILDGASGVMLSGESALGKYPVEAVTMMERIALVAEKYQKIIKIGE